MDLKTLHRPPTGEAAFRTFAESEGNGLYVAGGTIVVHSGAELDFLIDVSTAGLAGVLPEPDGALVIGATTTVSELARSEAASAPGDGVLVSAARGVANHTVRNLATVGGNIVSWHFPTDLPAVLLALDADLSILSQDGPRNVPLRDFFARRSEVFSPGDLILSVRVPASGGLVGAFEKIGRKRLDVAVVNAAAVVQVSDGVFGEVRVAVNGTGGPPLRLEEAERTLTGSEVSEDAVREAASLVSSLAPREDVRASAEYRSRVAEVAVRRALTRAAGMNG